MKENQFGKVSILSLEASSQNGKTVLSDVHFTAPYKVMQPFLMPDGGIQVMLLAASAGIMEGDRQAFSFYILPGAKVEFLSQSYDKIHPMNSGDAKRLQDPLLKTGWRSNWKTKLPFFRCVRSLPVDDMQEENGLHTGDFGIMWRYTEADD